MRVINPALPSSVRNFTTQTFDKSSSAAILSELRQSINTAFLTGFNKDKLWDLYEATNQGLEKILDKSNNRQNQDATNALKMRKFMNTLLDASPYLRDDIGPSQRAKPDLSQVFHGQFLDEVKGSVNDRVMEHWQIKSAMVPADLAQLGIKDHGTSRLAAGPKMHNKLTLDQAMALTAYTHQKWGLFNAINMANRMPGMEGPKAFFMPFHQVMKEAQHALHGNPNFHKTGMQVFKGMRTLNAFELGEKLAAARYMKEQGYSSTVPHSLSTTTDESQSYANRKMHDIELKITNASVYDVHRFNHPSTAHEKEALIPERARLRPTNISQREIVRGEYHHAEKIWVIEMKQISDPITDELNQRDADTKANQGAAARGRHLIETQK